MTSTFPKFQKLPLEVQQLVWFYCLPRRVAEKDRMWYVDGMPLEEACENSFKRIRQNDRIPLLASVCRQSRQVTLRHGHWHRFKDESGDDVSSDDSIWVQPKLDTLHFNWTRLRFFDLGCSEAIGPFGTFLASAVEESMPLSIMAPIIVDFPVKKHDNPSFLAAHIDINQTAEGRELDLVTFNEELPPGCLVDVVVTSISFHLPRKKGCESGFFGILGDESVQTVPCADKVRLRAYHNLFQTFLLGEAEPDVAQHFEFIMSDKFQDEVHWWLQCAEWKLLADMWRTDYLADKLTPEEAGQVWHPSMQPINEKYRLTIADCTFDETNPWVQQHRKKLIKIRPMVMFRHCTEPCT